MIGAENGLVQKVCQNLSHVIGIHCVAHRLNLSVLSSVKDGKCIDDLEPWFTLGTIWNDLRCDLTCQIASGVLFVDRQVFD